MARPGAQAPVKPNLYTEEEIAALAAYVATLGPGPAIPEPEEYDPANSATRIWPEAASSSGPTARPATTSRAPAGHCPTANTRRHCTASTTSGSMRRC